MPNYNTAWLMVNTLLYNDKSQHSMTNVNFEVLIPQYVFGIIMPLKIIKVRQQLWFVQISPNNNFSLFL